MSMQVIGEDGTRLFSTVRHPTWRTVARNVGRISDENSAVGSGVVLRGGLLLTNLHVLRSVTRAKRMHVALGAWRGREPEVFELDPSACFISDPSGDPLDIILHHPRGEDLCVSDRDGIVVSVEPPKVLYLADTDHGSSGAPVFDEHWRIVAIHTQGAPLGNTGLLAASVRTALWSGVAPSCCWKIC